MEDLKSTKRKQFIKKYKEPIIIVGEVIACGVIGGIIGGRVRKREVYKIEHNTSIISFQETIKWFDKHYENLNLRGLWETYVEENPDKISFLVK